MSVIDKIGQGTAGIVSRTLGAVSKTKPMKGLTGKFQGNFEDALAWTTVGSILIKDGIGCYKYTTQSMRNKEIPDDKRAFVTSMDLTNGILMIGTQLAMFAIMRKYSKSMFEWFFKKSFNPNAKRDMLTKLRMESTKLKEHAPRKIEAEKAYNEVKEDALGIFKFVFDIGVATIIGKRIITPLIATPLAGLTQKHIYPYLVGEKKRGDKKQEPQNLENVKDVEYVKVEEPAEQIK